MYRLELERLLAESPIIRSTDLRIEDEDDTIKIFGRLLFVDGSLLYFFEYHVLGELRKYRFHWFVAGIVLLAVLFVWKNSVCFVPPHEDGLEESKEGFASGKDYTQGLIGLLRRNISKQDILKVCVEEWEKSIEHGRIVNPDKLVHIKEVVERKEPKAKKNQDPVSGYNTINKILSPKIIK